MADPINVEFKSVGLSLKIDDATGPSTKGARRYRVRLRNVSGQVALSYLLTLRELSVLHHAITSELFRVRAQMSRRSDGIFDPLRQAGNGERDGHQGS